jgi:hypothetical protein
VWKLNEQAAAIRNNNWPVPGVPNPISRSVRFRSSASAYLNRTPAVASNRRTMTLSMWQKRGEFASSQEPAIMWAGTNSSNYTLFRWGDGVGDANSKFKLNLNMYTGSTNINLVTTPIYRDPSAWYHIVLSIDTTQATAANRVRLYINGTEVTSFSSASYPSQNLDLLFNSVIAHEIGRFNFGSYLDGYMTEVNFVDGQQLTPSSFGTTDPLTGVWEPIAYTGTYGTNGFYLNFKDNTSTTTLGYDYSGNSNNWTANNISLTSGSTYDSMLDVPTQWIGYSTTTDTSAVTRGNYAVLNPLANGGMTVTNANLDWTCGATQSNIVSTIAVSSGKWYFEYAPTTANPAGSRKRIGIALATYQPVTGAYFSGGSAGYAYIQNGNKENNGSASAYGATWDNGDIIGVALDLDAGTLAFYKNNSSQGTAYSSLSGTFVAAVGDFSSSGILNFGQRPFTYTPPSGFKSLNTTNLPDSTIVQGAAYMAASLYTGNAGSITVTNTVNGTSFQPDLVWVKARSSAYDNKLVDSVRGASGGIYYDLSSNSAAAQSLPGAGVNGLTSTGFTIGGGTNNGYNGNGTTFVAWQWKESPTSGFDIVTLTSQASGTATYAHNLGVAPRFIITKQITAATSWGCYHASLGNTGYVVLNSNAGFTTDANQWNNTSPTSSVFTLGPNFAGSVSTLVYLFADVAGFSKFGSYTGNGSTDGPFIYTGFRPRWIMVKYYAGSGANHWWVWDSARNTYNVMNDALVPNLSVAEQSPLPVDFTANGFKFRTSNGEMNGSGTSYIYAAFAENPFKNALAR